MSLQREDSILHSGDSDQETQSHDPASQKDDGSLATKEELGHRETRAVLRLRMMVRCCSLAELVVCGRAVLAALTCIFLCGYNNTN